MQRAFPVCTQCSRWDLLVRKSEKETDWICSSCRPNIYIFIFIIASYFKVKSHFLIWLRFQACRGGQANFFFNPQIANQQSLGSFRYRKSANFLGVPVCKSQIRKFFVYSANPKSTNFCKILYYSFSKQS